MLCYSHFAFAILLIFGVKTISIIVSTMIIIGATIIIIVLTKIGIVYCYVQRVRCSDVLKCHPTFFALTAQQVGMQNFASEIRTPILIVGIRTK